MTIPSESYYPSMKTATLNAPTPNLKIVPVAHVHPHETHDTQRAQPLLERIRHAEVLTNPPIVAPTPGGEYVLLDGANRHYCFAALGYKHILVQVVEYESDYVELGVWKHVLRDWERVVFVNELHNHFGDSLHIGWERDAIAHIMLQDGKTLAIQCDCPTMIERNEVLRQLVQLYHSHVRLNRTSLVEPSEIWSLYPDAFAVVIFPSYSPNDIITAAQQDALLPPGVSRHIIHGRALKLNYSLDRLRENASLEAKNAALSQWLSDKVANRGMRYYAESTYQFDE